VRVLLIDLSQQREALFSALDVRVEQLSLHRALSLGGEEEPRTVQLDDRVLWVRSGHGRDSQVDPVAAERLSCPEDPQALGAGCLGKTPIACAASKVSII
jgi:hypothetical protein